MDNKELLLKYYKHLINSCFKLIPLYNGEKYRSKIIIYEPEEAFKNFQIYLSNLLIEIHGNSLIFFHSENSVKLLSILKGMISQVGCNEHTKVKRLTMECINICKKIIKEIESEE
jgi:hypothetical protein